MINSTHKHSVQPPLRLGGVRILEFWVFGGGQNSFDFKGLVYSVGGVGGRVFILHPMPRLKKEDLSSIELHEPEMQIFKGEKKSKMPPAFSKRGILPLKACAIKQSWFQEANTWTSNSSKLLSSKHLFLILLATTQSR